MRVRAMAKARAAKAQRRKVENDEGDPASKLRSLAETGIRKAELAEKASGRSDVLAEAERIVNGDRDQQYGSPEDNFALIAKLWSDYLEVEIKPHDVAALMMLLKVARVRREPTKRDHWVDIAGYAACGSDCVGA